MLITYLSYIHTYCGILSSLTQMGQKNVEVNLVYENDIFNHDPHNITQLDVTDFFEHLKRIIDHLINDDNVQT